MKIVAIDFAGTLLTQEVIDRANEKRSELIEREVPKADEHQDTEILYKTNREALSKLTDITENMTIQSTEYNAITVTKSGKDILNEISTNLFQLFMYQVARDNKEAIFKKDMIDVLQRIRDKGYHLAIYSGIRTDIISGMLKIAGINLFDSIHAQPGKLGLTNKDLLDDISTLGEISYIIGDKVSDLDYRDGIKIFVDWGQGEDAKADHTVSTPEELLTIISDLDDHESV